MSNSTISNIGLIVFVALWIGSGVALVVDLRFNLDGTTTITEFATAHRWLAVLLVGLVELAVFALAVHFTYFQE